MGVKRLAAKQLITDASVVPDPLVTIEDGRIVGIATRDAELACNVEYDFPDATLTAGFLDMHFHGIAGQDVMNATPEGFQEIGRYLARGGVTRFLPTTVTASFDTTRFALERMARSIERDVAEGCAEAVGIHIEGPFLSNAKRGMHPAEHLLEPSPELLNRLWEAARGHIRLMTIAPEVPGALETIEHAKSLGIRCSIGHSMATKAEALAAIRAGAISATHTYNAMRPLDHREPGILGVVLDWNDLYADLICDGYHVAAEAVRMWLKLKGPERAILITDCLSAAGMPNGTYMAGETRVHVEGDACRTEAGLLAGSIITLEGAVRNLRTMTGADLAVAAGLASRNPAKMLGLPHVVERGALADFNVYGADGDRQQTIVRGRLVE